MNVEPSVPRAITTHHPVRDEPTDRETLRRVWRAMGCAPNPDDFKPSERAAMWKQVIEWAEEQATGDTRLARENQKLEAALRAMQGEPMLAEHAEERGQGICRTCLSPIWDEGGTVGHQARDTGWSDRIESGGDSLVCFKAVEYRHVPLSGREAAIYDRAVLRTAGVDPRGYLLADIRTTAHTRRKDHP